MTIELDARDLDLARFIKPGDVVVCGQDSGEPLTLTQALIAQQPRIGALSAFVGFSITDTFDPQAAPDIAYTGFGAMGTLAKLSRAGRIDVRPCHYSQLPELFTSERWRADVVLTTASPGVAGGPMSWGTSQVYCHAAAQRARVVIVEVNDRMPWLYGAEVSADQRVDLVVRTSRQIPQAAGPRIGEVERQIAAHVAGLIPDGATIQLGVGAVPDAIAVALAHHKHLGVHTGMLTESIVPLIEAGVVDNSTKPIDRGVTVSGFFVGTDAFYAKLHRNRAMLSRPPTYTHALHVVAQISKFISINTAIEVDLAGRVNAEVADGVYVGGTGGAADYTRGAQLSEGGRAIVALLSTARKGTVSRIVSRCEAAVTVTPADVDTVVTEYGVAELKGQSLAERARRMIAIAHPAFREELERAHRSRSNKGDA